MRFEVRSCDLMRCRRTFVHASIVGHKTGETLVTFIMGRGKKEAIINKARHA